MDTTLTLPREDLVRALNAGPEYRDASDGDGEVDARPTLRGHFAVFDQWTEIDSHFEGNFLERIAPGAFSKTMKENRADMRVLLNHGGDPQVGDKPIGAITDLREDDTGAYYEASLFDGIPPLVMDGLRAGQYGASFRFRVLREDIVRPKAASDSNPAQLPERTIREAMVREFGPVTFPAYAGATANVRSVDDDGEPVLIVRSITDDLLIHRLTHHLLAEHPPSHAARTGHLAQDAPPVEKAAEPRFRNREDYLQWLSTYAT